MWLSGINSDGEKGREGGEGKRIKLQWIVLFSRFKHLMRCRGQSGMDSLNLPKHHQH